MENNEVFSYQYSAKRNKEIEEIRGKYLPKEKDEIETLRELDRRVKRPANIFAYVFGGISAIIMGAGMSLVMTDIGTTLGMDSTMLPGIAIGVFGMLMALINYPMYKGILDARKEKYGKEIIAFSDKIINKI